MTVFVKYLAPVMPEVDLDLGEVVRVVVDDDAMRVPVEVIGDDMRAVGSALHDTAVRIAESTTWPSCTYGW